MPYQDYFPESQVDFVHSMEFIYYLEDLSVYSRKLENTG